MCVQHLTLFTAEDVELPTQEMNMCVHLSVNFVKATTLLVTNFAS